MFTNCGRVAEGERKVSGRGGAGERQGTLLTKLCTVGCCCWLWPRSINNDWQRQKHLFFSRGDFDHFWANISKSEIYEVSEIFPNKSFCNWSIGLAKFVHWSDNTFLAAQSSSRCIGVCRSVHRLVSPSETFMKKLFS